MVGCLRVSVWVDVEGPVEELLLLSMVVKLKTVKTVSYDFFMTKEILTGPRFLPT